MARNEGIVTRRWLVALLVMSACGRIDFDPLTDPDLGPFGPPTPIDLFGPADNPWPTDDLLELYFDSARAGGAGNNDIWRSKRTTRNDPWGEPEPVVELNTASQDEHPHISADGLALYLESDRPGGLGKSDIWMSTRPTTTAAWGPPMDVVELSSPEGDEPGLPSRDQRRVIITSGRVGAKQLFESVRGGVTAPWGTPVELGELSVYPNQSSWLSPSRLTLYFTSTRPTGAGGRDLWIARRPAVDAPFEEPIPITELNTSSDEADAWLSPDQRIIVFRSGSPAQIVMATR